ncbi:hypothetical protein Zmor_004462 [Zophobas morio]|uniref:Uncharacterized protein n=1 Tax=Zophobas morio TaxID=2755281 RepID=A0AA38HIW3_9CUCU|nr:hypothetical protein Zmor_004462 [Zophobas morio]
MYGRPGSHICDRPLQIFLKVPPPSELGAIFASDFSAVLWVDLNCKHPTWNSRTGDHIPEAYVDGHGLSILGHQRPRYLATGTMDLLDIAVLEDIRLTTAFEALHELSSYLLPVIRIWEREGHTHNFSLAFLPLGQLC